MSALSSEELDGLLQRTLAQAGEALTLPAIERALPSGLRPARSTLAARLAALARDGRAHRWPGRRPQYAARPYADYLRGWLLETLGEKPQSLSDLRKRVPASAHATLSATLGELRRDGKLFLRPPLHHQRSARHSTRAPDPLEYLRRPVEAELKKLQKKGFSREALLEALVRFAGGPAASAPEAEPADRVLEALVQLNPKVREGDLVFLPHLRHTLSDEMDRASFDRAVLALLTQGRIQLQAHPVPGQLEAAEREAMIPDGRGSCFMAIGLRRT